MPGSLESIVILQKTLNELTEVEKRLQGIPDWMRELHQEHADKKAEIDTVVETAQAATRERRAAEAQLQDAQEKLKHYQQQISRVSTQREYGALLKEIDTVKSQSSALEQQALSALEESEKANTRLAELEQSFKELDSRYQAELAKWEGEKPELARRAGELGSQVRELRAAIPQGPLRMFDRLIDRYGGDAVARVVRGEAGRGANAVDHCSACNYRIRPQVVVEIRERATFVQCDYCKRILYHESVLVEA
ncbi:MAG: hypothetical protein HC897_18130 [Thermoanaerobaculia bacterium]|nr:hypothetical protein [Thermoanaerobaculia bacterium]